MLITVLLCLPFLLTLPKHLIALNIVNYFIILFELQTAACFIRLLLNMYTGHVTRVLWIGISSYRFSVILCHNSLQLH